MIHSHANALFISDLHLTEDRPDCIRAFFRFLDWIPADIEALFILGDFFEYWVGDDIETELTKNIADQLRQTANEKKIAIYFVPGNRDFSLGSTYCQQCQMQLLADNSLVSIAGKQILIAHGDLLCTDDKAYQRFRRIIRHRWVMTFLLWLPIAKRLKIAENLRQKSKTSFQRKPVIVDVNEDAVVKNFQQFGQDIMVHGHTHLADIHLLSIDDETKKRVVLGDWHTVGWYAKLGTDGPSLHQFSVANPKF